MAAAETSNGRMEDREENADGLLQGPNRVPHPHVWDPDFELDDAVYKSNISQTEYIYKHRLFFEEMHRSEKKKRRRKRETFKTVPYRRIHPFEITDSRTWSSSHGQLTRSFTYDMNIPQKRNSISQIDHADLHLQIIPTKCMGERQVTLKVLEEEKKVHVDACRPRWESLSVYPLPSLIRTLNITCLDCDSKEVTFTAPYLNVVSTANRKIRSARSAKTNENNMCRLSRLVINFKKLKNFKNVMNPRTVDIGRCRGSCAPDFRPHSQHAFFIYDRYKLRNKGPLPCCTPSKYKDLEYLMPNHTHLQKYHWPDAIATQCTCR